MELTSVGTSIYDFGSLIVTGGYRYSLDFGSVLCNKIIVIAQAILASETFTAIAGLVAGIIILRTAIHLVGGFYSAYYPTAARTNAQATSLLPTLT